MNLSTSNYTKYINIKINQSKNINLKIIENCKKLPVGVVYGEVEV